MITLTFGKMFKKPNSTKQTMEDEVEVSVSLKKNVDIKAPIFEVNFDTSNYNYIKWEQEDYPTRYYWIDNTVYVHNALFEVHCSMDLAATYKALFQYGTSGHCLYCSDETYWDENFDDLRFSPSHLDTYKTRGFEYDPDYLYETANILGPDDSMWDLTDGVYVLNCISNGTISGAGGGPHWYLLNTAEFKTFMTEIYNFWTGGPFQSASARVDAIRSLQWYPIDKDALITKLGTNVYTADIELAGSTVLSNADCLKGYPCNVSFQSVIKIPRDDADQPNWMSNSRWNSLQLYTPAGYTDLNLDFIYPLNHYYLGISTTWEICSGDMDIKITYELKSNDTWNDTKQTIAYTGSMNCGVDCMSLIERNADIKQDVWKSVALGASVAAGAFTAGATAAPSAIAKIKAADAMSNSIFNLKQNGNSIADTFKQQAYAEIAGQNSGNIGKLIAGGIMLSKLNPPINMASAGGNCGNSLANYLNTSEFGLVRLRMKPFRCKELADDGTEEELTPLYKYQQYCSKFGYPVNQYWFEGLPLWVGPQYVVIENAQFDTSNPYVKDNVLGITDEELVACQQLIGSGLWIE